MTPATLCISCLVNIDGDVDEPVLDEREQVAATARLAARGDERSAVAAAHSVAPGGAVVRIRRDGGFVVATVAVQPTLLRLLEISASGVAAVEPP